MQSERTFRTDGGRDASVNMETIQISGLTCRVKKITVSDDGKLTMAIDATATDNEAIERVRDLIMIQQGEVMLTLEGVMVESTEQAPTDRSGYFCVAGSGRREGTMNLAETLGLGPRPYRILTIDGGGVRGIIPVLWLERLERYLNGPIHAHCDLIAGTSVGAILGCGFAMGMTAAEARQMWLNGAHVAFSKPHSMKERGRRIAARAGLMAKYESSGLEALLKSIFGDTRMGDLTPPTIALSYDIQSMQVHVFSSAKEEHKGLKVWEVCRASTAAPLFWDPHLMALDDSGVRHPMADGGMTANNPVVLAISESVSHAKGTGKAVPLENVVVASFGTGSPPEGQTQIPKTIFGHGSMIMRALMTGATGTDHVTARTMLPAKNYWRFQTSIAGRLAPLDDIENIDELQAVAMAHLADGADQRLGQLARRLQGKPLDRRWWEGGTEEAIA